MLRHLQRRKFLGDNLEDNKNLLIGSAIRGLTLVERLLRGSCCPRRHDAGPGLPLQQMKDTWTGDAQREEDLFVPDIKLVGVRATDCL